MIVTLTSKGQLTLPKRIREQMKLDAGSKLDFEVRPDGTLTARALNRSVDTLFGMLHRPGMRAASIEQMHADRDAALAADDLRIKSAARRRPPARAKKAA